MSNHIYANLIGNWVDLTIEPTATINEKKPYLWWEESATMYAPFDRKQENTMYELPYINIDYKGANYRISPTQIQVVVK